jgi:hypothetical protein
LPTRQLLQNGGVHLLFLSASSFDEPLCQALQSLLVVEISPVWLLRNGKAHLLFPSAPPFNERHLLFFSALALSIILFSLRPPSTSILCQSQLFVPPRAPSFFLNTDF